MKNQIWVVLVVTALTSNSVFAIPSTEGSARGRSARRNVSHVILSRAASDGSLEPVCEASLSQDSRLTPAWLNVSTEPTSPAAESPLPSCGRDALDLISSNVRVATLNPQTAGGPFVVAGVCLAVAAAGALGSIGMSYLDPHLDFAAGLASGTAVFFLTPLGRLSGAPGAQSLAFFCAMGGAASGSMVALYVLRNQPTRAFR